MLAEASLELKAVEIEIAHEKLNAKVSRERGGQHVDGACVDEGATGR